MRERENTQIMNATNERKDITTDPMDMERIIKENHEQLCAHKFANLDERDQFFERHNLLKHTRRNR